MAEGAVKPVTIVIVGGGTAGWLTAALLNRKLGATAKIKLVESANIPTVGVGEATVPTLRKTLHDLDIDEADFMAATDATFKHGILFRDWLTAGPSDFYYHTFENFSGEALKFTDMHEGAVALTGQSAPDVGAAWLNSALREDPSSYAYRSGVQATLCDRMLGPKAPGMFPYQGLVPYAYHLDAARLGEYLATLATARGVERILADVTGWKQSAEGEIESIILSDGSHVEGDLFVDCSGFRALLIGEALQTPFVSYGQYLLCDRAMVIQIPHQEPRKIRPYTTASAASAGWIWEIDTRGRQGTGYVYSSQFTSDEEVIRTLSSHHQIPAEGFRKIKFQSGRRAESWCKNVVAIGLSGGFLEPLESTGIFLIERAAALLASCAPNWRHWSSAEKFNAKMSVLYEEIRDFLVLHYHLTKRQDSAFWREVQRTERVPESLAKILDVFDFRQPEAFDTDDGWRCFTFASYRAVLWGMGRLPATPLSAPTIAHMLYMPWAADRISDKVEPHIDSLKGPRPPDPPESMDKPCLQLDVPAGVSIELCSGTRQPSSAERQTLELEHSSIIPVGDWQEASDKDLADWFVDEAMQPGLKLSVVKLPSHLAEGFLQIGRAMLSSTAESRHQPEHKRAVLNLLAGIVENYGDPKNVTRPLGVGRNLGNLPVTTRGSRGQRIGLHVDNWSHGEALDRGNSDNRICVNIGSTPRRLLFLPVPLASAAASLERLGAREAPVLGPTDIARLYMRSHPHVPVFSVQIDPGHAYIAPTENIIHDGSTRGSNHDDLFVTYLGRFAPRRD